MSEDKAPYAAAQPLEAGETVYHQEYGECTFLRFYDSMYAIVGIFRVIKNEDWVPLSDLSRTPWPIAQPTEEPFTNGETVYDPEGAECWVTPRVGNGELHVDYSDGSSGRWQPSQLQRKRPTHAAADLRAHLTAANEALRIQTDFKESAQKALTAERATLAAAVRAVWGTQYAIWADECWACDTVNDGDGAYWHAADCPLLLAARALGLEGTE